MSDPRNSLAALSELGITPIEACRAHAAANGYEIGPMAFIVGVLNSINSALKSYNEDAGNSNNSPENQRGKASDFIGLYQRNELRARNWLIQQLNSGRLIAIGKRAYSNNRTEWRYVWDGRLSAKQFDWSSDRYCGPRRQFNAIRIVRRTDCSEAMLQHFDRTRMEKIGRPKSDGLELAIERVAEQDPRFDKHEYFKNAVYFVEIELQEMRNRGEIDKVPKKRTIEEAIRKRRTAI